MTTPLGTLERKFIGFGSAIRPLVILLVAFRVNPPVAVPRAVLGGGAVLDKFRSGLDNFRSVLDNSRSVLDNSSEYEANPTLAVLDTVFFCNQ